MSFDNRTQVIQRPMSKSNVKDLESCWIISIGISELYNDSLARQDKRNSQYQLSNFLISMPKDSRVELLCATLQLQSKFLKHSNYVNRARHKDMFSSFPSGSAGRMYYSYFDQVDKNLPTQFQYHAGCNDSWQINQKVNTQKFNGSTPPHHTEQGTTTCFMDPRVSPDIVQTLRLASQAGTSTNGGMVVAVPVLCHEG
ncbi:predicted protein [Sclerotinia sclerotiorum 1980 UF-70]|uniref:Uncharacterized protein n=1 Tax=Sclerotinia sclerotiorum (strain ATCC 18683 / 1980 / Ss-1) TaxID=665079 RepID=A7EDY8_SCLS1|nr:predicted protein [Sclerotinia sclerotiorum 1980 UF-70]EDO01054.1 predicted protein [Sclerotinia sclerotiorum 1980 UF-70]